MSKKKIKITKIETTEEFLKRGGQIKKHPPNFYQGDIVVGMSYFHIQIQIHGKGSKNPSEQAKCNRLRTKQRLDKLY